MEKGKRKEKSSTFSRPWRRPKVPIKDVSTAPKLKADPTFAGIKARSSGVNEKEGDFESKEEQDLGDVKAKDEEGESSVEAEAAISLAEAKSKGSVCDESSSAPNEDEEESEYEEEEESEEDLEGEIGEVDTIPNVGFSQVMDSVDDVVDVNLDVGENPSCFRGERMKQVEVKENVPAPAPQVFDDMPQTVLTPGLGSPAHQVLVEVPVRSMSPDIAIDSRELQRDLTPPLFQWPPLRCKRYTLSVQWNFQFQLGVCLH
ncbi:hypothetical protein U1Q18_022049 [Sarracenia purpurea var. burkii]